MSTNYRNTNARLEADLARLGQNVGEHIPASAAAEQLAAVAANTARTNASLQQLAKQMMPKLFSVQQSFQNATDAQSPKLSVDLPIALTWFQFQAPRSAGATVTWAGIVNIYDHDGALLVATFSLVNPASGPQNNGGAQILCKKNLSVAVANDSAGGVPPYPLYVVLQGIQL